MNILIGITGSVATKLIGKLCKQILCYNPDSNLKIVATDSSLHFLNSIPEFFPGTNELFIENCNTVKVFCDKDRWNLIHDENVKKDIPIHIYLRNWADIGIIAPLSANTLAKVANGICDNLLTEILRAWFLDRPLIMAPAMNTQMWLSPRSQEHLEVLICTYEKFVLINPISKQLQCGEEGIGAMARIEDIVLATGINKGLVNL